MLTFLEFRGDLAPEGDTVELAASLRLLLFVHRHLFEDTDVFFFAVAVGCSGCPDDHQQ